MFVLDDGARVSASKAILGEATPVFNAMFGGSFLESNLTEIHVPQVQTRAFSLVLDLIHTHRSISPNDQTTDVSIDGMPPCELSIKVTTVNEAVDEVFIQVLLDALNISEQYMLEDLKSALLFYIFSQINSSANLTIFGDVFTLCPRHFDARILLHCAAAHIVTNRSALGMQQFQRLVRAMKFEFISVLEDLLYSALA